ncbi:uncharacterized protein G2W53_017474 [Senna tora]|uniref:Uncharacterized protein n=1 Tax=Senna tora TaxID=362788 RepID=A0A834WK83_9FABA|nr:uncharacterized protein G2W53_017474 [Senna tora]
MRSFTMIIPNRTLVDQLVNKSDADIKFQTIIADIHNICTNKGICISFQFGMNHHRLEVDTCTWPIGWLVDAPERKYEKPKAKLRSRTELQKFNDIFTC